MADNPQVMARFDASYESYDPEDLAAARSPNKIFQQDQAAEFGGASLFFARQLDYVKTRVYNRKFPEINADMLVPDATDTPEWAESISVHSYDSVGMAKIIANYADDLPRVDVRGMVQLVPVKTLGDSYGYNINEIKASRAIGAGLDVRKAEAARRAIDLKIARIKMVGDDDYGLFGLFNYPNVPITTLTNVGPWSALDGREIYENMNHMMYTFMIQSQGVHTANMMALSPTAYHNAATKFYIADPAAGGPLMVGPVTALALFNQMHPGVRVVNVIECERANTAAPNVGHDVAFLYELSPENLSHEYVMPFTQLPAEARNLEFVINCMARSGGVHIYYPLAFLKATTGLLPP